MARIEFDQAGINSAMTHVIVLSAYLRGFEKEK
jgi:hypothetical protein